jgi:hypothetical protein
MKKKIFAKLAIVLFALILTGCSDDNNDKVETQEDFVTQAKKSTDVDAITDDLMSIIENEYNSQNTTGRSPQGAQDFLPECVTITSTLTGGNWTTVLDFGTTGCPMPNGNILKGIITITGSTNFAAMSQTINYSFDGFYHNNRLIEGNKYVERVLENANGNPQSTIELDLSVTFPNGEVVSRTGNRIWEWTEGADTILNPFDNVYLVTGAWVTTFPNNALSTEITSALKIKMTCSDIVEGTVSFSTDNNTLVLDYGDGTCDNIATIAINGGAESTIILE